MSTTFLFILTIMQWEGNPNVEKAVGSLKDKGFTVKGKPVSYVGIAENFGLEDSDLAALKDIPTIRQLRLIYTPKITGAGLKYVRGLKELEEISLYGNKLIDDVGMGYLAHLRKLEFLDLANTGVGDDGAEALASIGALRWLSLTGTRITNRAM